MPADVTALNAAVTALTDQVAVTETTEAGAVTLINGEAQAIKDALIADNTIDQANTDAAVAIVEQVRQRFAASAQALGAAVVANTPGGPPPSPTSARR